MILKQDLIDIHARDRRLFANTVKLTELGWTKANKKSFDTVFRFKNECNIAILGLEKSTLY